MVVVVMVMRRFRGGGEDNVQVDLVVVEVRKVVV